MIRVLPILFNTEMVKAVERKVNPKTATRRVIKGFIPNDAVWGYTIFTPEGCISCRGTFADGYGEKFFKLPCQPKDILYVREKWCRNTNFEEYYYAAKRKPGADAPYGLKWRPSIHMPKEAARIWLKVTDVRPERLQDITHVDIIMEGVKPEYIDAASGEKTRNDFSKLWDSTIKKSKLGIYGWKANPWVWAIEFERCEKPEPCILKGIGSAEDKRPCIGYGDAWADEPCEMCKGCRQCTGREED